MASTTSGLTRRRGGGAAANNGDEDGGRVSSPAPRRIDDRTPETSYESSANGHRIAYDPRDISESAERSKQPKLTLMEEIILMGLKDRQVGASATLEHWISSNSIVRVTSRSGMIISRML
jgi:Golgi phosphoprotein 3